MREAAVVLMRLKYVMHDTDRHGNRRYYYRRHGKKIRLQGEPGSAEFMASLEQAKQTGKAAPVSKADPASMRALLEGFYRSAAFKGLDGRSQRVRMNILEAWAGTKGRAEKPFRMVERRHVLPGCSPRHLPVRPPARGRAYQGSYSVTDRPIIFSAPMVRAILEGRKTQTRRVLKPQPFPVGGPFYRPHTKTAPREWHSVSKAGTIINIQTVPYAVGDRLWVREAWRTSASIDDTPPRDMFPRLRPVSYEADYSCEPNDGCGGRLRPSIHMPRWASRITLEVTGVEVERLHEISAADSIAEGVQCTTCEAMNSSACNGLGCFASLEAFADLWSSIHGPGAWEANPWVAAIEFKRIP